MNLKSLLAILFAMLLATNIDAQQKLTKEQIMSMTIEELSELPLEDLMDAVETLGVSSVDELFALIMNKNVSSASKEEEDSFTSPLSTTVITKAEMRTYGITTIEEAFRLIPGMIVTEKTNGVYDIHMRGLNNIPDNNMLLYTENANTLVMVDGRQIQNSVMGAITLEMLPISIEDINRIEVVRGACGALYGSNAVSGVINIITDKPGQQTKSISGNLQAGNKDTYIGEIALRHSFANDKFNIGLTFNIQKRGRGTDNLYVIPSDNLFMAADDNVLANTVSTQVFGDPASQTLTSLTGNQYTIGKDLIPMTNGGFYSISDVQKMRELLPVDLPLALLGIQGQPNDRLFVIHNATEPETPIKSMFPDPDVSRKNTGVNGYISIVPNADIRFDITGGYGESKAMSTPVGDDIFSFNERKFETGYVNLNSRIHGLSLNYGYEFGPQDYALGVPGFKISHYMMNANTEYTFKLGDLSLKPGFEFQWSKFVDYLPVFNDETHANGNYSWHFVRNYDRPADNNTRLYGFLDKQASLRAIAPSLRLDYKVNDFRFIGAFRADKTNIPDKWNPSWQFAANYSINNNNFIRLVYGRANRGANLVNTNAAYQWIRTNMQPQRMIFVGNEESNLVKIDNIELGYRWKPTSNVLVDAEFFFSHSEDFGGLMSKESMRVLSSESMGAHITKAITEMVAAPTLTEQFLALSDITQSLYGSFESRSNIQYKNLPYKVNQMGLSVNVDWIVSPKLIVKLNANLQNTRINDYYQYSQIGQITAQSNTSHSQIANCTLIPLAKASALVQAGNVDAALAALTDNIAFDFVNVFKTCTEAGMSPEQISGLFLGYSPVDQYREATGYNNLSENEKKQILQDFYANGIQGGTGEVYGETFNKLGMYYALKYNIRYNTQSDEYFFGSTLAEEYQLSNNHKHKATPTAYGMIGLIYKPLSQLNVSAFGNYIGKRTVDTMYGARTLDGRFTVNMKIGYCPTQNFELFFNAHNLFNSKTSEFVYSDKIDGLYTFGVNFGF